MPATSSKGWCTCTTSGARRCFRRRHDLHQTAAVRRRWRADRRQHHRQRRRLGIEAVQHPRRGGDRLGAAHRAADRVTVGASRRRHLGARQPAGHHDRGAGRGRQAGRLPADPGRSGTDRRPGRLHGRRPPGPAGPPPRRILRRAGGRGGGSPRGRALGQRERRRPRRGPGVHRAPAARAGDLADRGGGIPRAVMDTPSILLTGLVALLIGLAVGKAWERYKLHDGVWTDRRRARESPHYMLGLNFLVANQIDQAIDELSKAAQAAGDPLEIHLILGNLYREKGQVGRAIQEHQGLLQRPKLRKLEHANVLLCLGLDYRSGGFVDRAIEAFREVLKLDPDNRYALSNLEKLYEDQHQWTEAYAARQKLAALSAAADGGSESPRHDEVLAFLENEFGQAALKGGDTKEAARRFQAAIERDPRNTPAHLSLGDVSIRQGDTTTAVAVWEKMIASSPARAYLAFERLDSAYKSLGTPERFPALCEKLIAENPQDWRARMALAGH